MSHDRKETSPKHCKQVLEMNGQRRCIGVLLILYMSIGFLFRPCGVNQGCGPVHCGRATIFAGRCPALF